MATHSDISARTVAELVVQLGCLTRGEGSVTNLTFAQWTALRYFSSANRFSRTVSAFAEFHGTTRGTASQTIKSLVQNGYLTRKRSKSDCVFHGYLPRIPREACHRDRGKAAT